MKLFDVVEIICRENFEFVKLSLVYYYIIEMLLG